MSKKATYEELEQRIQMCEKALSERNASNNEIDNIFNLSPDLIGYGNLEGYFTKISSSLQKVLGYSENEFFAKPFMAFIHKDDVERTIEAFTVAQGGKRDIYVENRYKCKDGSYKWIDWYILSIVDENKFIAIGRDITTRKQNEIRQKESEELFSKIFAFSPTGMVITKQNDGKCVEVNDSFSKIFGYSRNEGIGRTSLELGFWPNPEDRARVINYLQEQNVIKDMEIEFLNRQGELRIGRISLAPVNIKRESCIITSIEDITDQKKTEESLHQAHDFLEERVKERTKALELNKKSLEEVNSALNVLLKKRDEDKKHFEENILFNVKELIKPQIKNLKNTGLNNSQAAYISALEAFLKDIVSPFPQTLHTTYKELTISEIKVANLIREGKTTKEIAVLLKSTQRAIDFHRQNLRKKLGLNNRKINLASHLLSLQ